MVSDNSIVVDELCDADTLIESVLVGSLNSFVVPAVHPTEDTMGLYATLRKELLEENK